MGGHPEDRLAPAVDHPLAEAPVVGGAFATSDIQATYSAYAALIDSYATTEISGYSFLRNSGDFQNAIAQLNAHVSERASAASAYLGGN